jgi:DNA-binding beta-propeller fold protein YncE
MIDKRATRILSVMLLGFAGLAGAASYEVVGKLPVGGEGGWDYLVVDAHKHLLYLAHGTLVTVVDTSSGTTVGEIADTPGVHGIALAAPLGRGYISVGKADAVEVFDLRTRASIAMIAVGSKPDAIVYEPATRQVFAFNGLGGSVSVIDAAANRVVATLALDGAPEFARTDEHGLVFVNIVDKNQLAKIDARTRRVLARWDLPGCERPSGLALDAAHRRSFSVCGNEVMSILDTRTGRSLATLPIGKGVDGAEFDPGTHDAVSSNGEGTLTVVHESDPEHFAVTQTLATARGARTVALDAKTHTLFLPSAEFGSVEPSAADPHPRPPVLPNTLFIIEIAKIGAGPPR